jgi:protein SCO1/2
MSRSRKMSLGRISVLVAVASVFAFVGDASAASSGSHWGANYFPNVSLTTQDGATVHFYDDLLKGKIVGIDLIYTHCKDECPLETAKLAQVQRLLGDRVGKDIFFYSISLDPEHDTPAVLKAYADKFHAGPGWLFLTGKKEDIDLISKKLGLYTPNWGRDGHVPSLMLGNEPTGQWVRSSAVDNPRFIATTIHNFLDSWQNAHGAARKSYTQAPTLSVTKGQYLFRTRCSACHSIGRGDAVGPDLLGVTKQRDRKWLARFIATPDEVLASDDPLAKSLYEKYKQVQMPNLRLSAEDVNTLIDYLEHATPGAATVAAQDSAHPTAHGGTKQ